MNSKDRNITQNQGKAAHGDGAASWGTFNGQSALAPTPSTGQRLGDLGFLSGPNRRRALEPENSFDSRGPVGVSRLLGPTIKSPRSNPLEGTARTRSRPRSSRVLEWATGWPGAGDPPARESDYQHTTVVGGRDDSDLAASTSPSSRDEHGRGGTTVPRPRLDQCPPAERVPARAGSREREPRPRSRGTRDLSRDETGKPGTPGPNTSARSPQLAPQDSTRVVAVSGFHE